VPADNLDWVLVKGATDRTIGAIGFVGDTAAVAVAFFDDKDANQDGTISLGERIVAIISPIRITGKAVTEVVMAARGDPDIMLRDPSYRIEAAKLFLDFATGLVFDGLYAVYFSRGVRHLATGVAASAASGLVKQYVIRKGMEASVKALYNQAIRNQTAFGR
jgi:hypothetical protein